MSVWVDSNSGTAQPMTEEKMSRTKYPELEIKWNKYTKSKEKYNYWNYNLKQFTMIERVSKSKSYIFTLSAVNEYNKKTVEYYEDYKLLYKMLKDY